MFRIYLLKDAFARAPERKEGVIKEYKMLYPKEPVIREYVKEAKFEFQSKKIQRKQFQDQFSTIIDSIQAWGHKNGCNNSDLLAKVEQCKKNFFEASYSGSQSAEYFSSTKLNLENIWFTLEFDKNIPLGKKKEIYDYLCNSMNVCAPGLYTHIEDICNSLNSDVSLERWLTDFRTSIIRIFADRHMQEYKISEGFSIHVYTAFIIYALNEGWNPLSNMNKHSDPFAATADTHIEAEHLPLFT